MREVKEKLSSLSHVSALEGPTISGRGLLPRIHGSLSNRLITEEMVFAAAKASGLRSEVKGTHLKRSVGIQPLLTNVRAFQIFLRRAHESRRVYYPKFEIVAYNALSDGERGKIFEFFQRLREKS